MRPPRLLRASSLFAAVAAALVLAGCATTPEPAPAPTGSAQPAPPSSAAPAPSVSKPEVTATFDPSGTAEANKDYFDQTLQAMLAENRKASSHDFVDTLAAAGFDKQAMEVTFDRTTVDLEADYIIVSVKTSDNKCLIGQRSTRGYKSIIAEPMSTGKCLIGKTQEITW